MAEQKPAKYLTRKEFFALPMEERRKLLAEQVNNPAVLSYYEGMDKPEPPDMPMDGHSTMSEQKRLDSPDREKIKQIIDECEEFTPPRGWSPASHWVNSEKAADQILAIFDDYYKK